MACRKYASEEERAAARRETNRRAQAKWRAGHPEEAKRLQRAKYERHRDKIVAEEGGPRRRRRTPNRVILAAIEPQP